MRYGEMINGAFEKMFSSRYKKYLIMAALGLALIAVSAAFESSSTDNGAEQTGETAKYCSEQEQRLEQILSLIEGVGKTYVMLTLENGVEYRYAADEKQSGDSVFTYSSGSSSPSKVQESENTEQSYILIGSSGEKRPLVLTELSPKVRGVVVVCEGGDNPIIRQRVTEAVKTALGISSLQICVTKSSK